MSLFDCELTRNISLNNSGGGGTDSCNGSDNSVAVGGISSPCYIYNINQIQNLKFSGDNRADDSLFVSEIITDSAFYSIDFSSADFNEDYDDGLWSQTLTLTIASANDELEDIIADAVNSRFFVCFRPNGATDYRAFGWKNGSSLSYSFQVSEDNWGYTLTLSDTSVFPLLTVDAENFNVRNKVFSPIFKPLYSTAICEESGGANTGYKISMYVVKVNSAGQALDSNNKLCQWSGNKQDAYKLSSVQSDGGYHIIGTYQSSASFDGLPVRVFDLSSCPSSTRGTITVDGSDSTSVALNSSTVSAPVSVYSTDFWTVVDNSAYVGVTPDSHNSGTTTAMVVQNGIGGEDVITLQNTATRERVTINATVCLIKIASQYTYPNGTTSIILTPSVGGGSCDYTYSISPSVTATKEGSYLVLSPSTSDNQQQFTVTLTHTSDANEVKTVNITILGNDTEASWQILSKFCEIEE